VPTASSIRTKLQSIIAPDNNPLFFRVLSEADDRLLSSGHWAWTRVPLDLPVVDGVVTLPTAYRSIAGCRVGSMAAGVLWQDIEYLEGGPGEVPVQDGSGQLLDQGEVIVSGSLVRHYKCTQKDATDVVVLARHRAAEITNDSSVVLCPSFSAVKYAMLATLYSEAGDINRATGYLQMAKQALDEDEDAYRSAAKKIFSSSQYTPVRRRTRTNFP